MTVSDVRNLRTTIWANEAQQRNAMRNTLNDVFDEWYRAKLKHGDHTTDGILSSDMLRLATLMEEVGEVAHELTYDQEGTADEKLTRLRKELIQVASVATTWAAALI